MVPQWSGSYCMTGFAYQAFDLLACCNCDRLQFCHKGKKGLILDLSGYKRLICREKHHTYDQDSVITTHMGWWSHLQEQMQNNGQRCWHHLVQQLDHLIPDSYGMAEISEKNEDNYEDCNWAVEMSHQVSDLSRTVRHKHQLSLLPELFKHVDFQHPAVGSQSWHSKGKHCWQHQQSLLP